jgi:hypothetical protein
MLTIQLFDIPLASFLGVLLLSLLKGDFHISPIFFHILRRDFEIPLAGTMGEKEKNRHYDSTL